MHNKVEVDSLDHYFTLLTAKEKKKKKNSLLLETMNCNPEVDTP